MIFDKDQLKFRLISLTSINSFKFINNLLQNLTEIRTGQIRLKSRPLFLSFATPYKCNLKCRMCDDVQSQYEKNKHFIRDSYYDEVWHYYPYLMQLQTIGGEPFTIKEVRELIRKFDRNKYYFMDFGTITNGTLINDYWAEQIVRKMKWINVSINASTKKTFEWLHRGADFEQVLENCRRLIEWKKKLNDFSLYECAMITVTSANFREIPDFIKLVSELDFRAVMLQPMRGTGDLYPYRTSDSYGQKVKSLNLFEYPSEYCNELIDMKQVLNDTFSLLKCDANNNYLYIKKGRKDLNVDNVLSVNNISSIVNKLNLALKNIGQQTYIPPEIEKFDPNEYVNNSSFNNNNVLRKLSKIIRGNIKIRTYYNNEVKKAGLICIEPWQRLEIGWHGRASPCCEMFFDERKEFFGHINDSTIKELWNSEHMMALRKAIIENKMEKICRKECPVFGKSTL